MIRYRCRCRNCDFGGEVDSRDELFDLADQHVAESGTDHMVDFELLEGPWIQ